MVSGYLGSSGHKWLGKPGGFQNGFIRSVAAGTVSKGAGGKFANGAMTAAFSAVVVSRMPRTYASAPQPPGYKIDNSESDSDIRILEGDVSLPAESSTRKRIAPDLVIEPELVIEEMIVRGKNMNRAEPINSRGGWIPGTMDVNVAIAQDRSRAIQKDAAIITGVPIAIVSCGANIALCAKVVTLYGHVESAKSVGALVTGGPPTVGEGYRVYVNLTREVYGVFEKIIKKIIKTPTIKLSRHPRLK